MDTVISYDEVTALVASPPSLAPRPNFSNIRELRRHFQRALKRLACPQTAILGWSGLVTPRPLYTLLDPNPFRLPNSPGPQAIYPPSTAGQPPLSRAEQATIDATFIRQRNYYQSYLNIKRACFTVLDDSIDDAFKVSNIPTIVGWNTTMEIMDIFDQLANMYGRPTPAALLSNDQLYRSIYSPADAPEVLFRRIEDCQEVQILGNDPYTPQQLINNAIRLLLATGLYTRDFDDEWDRQDEADKTWPNLKSFIQAAYTRRLNATAATSGGQGYATHNAFNALASASDDDSVDTVGTQIAALTAHSQLTANTAATTSQQLAQLQMAQQQMMTQLAAMSVAPTVQQNHIMAPAMTPIAPSFAPIPQMQQPMQPFQYNNTSPFGSRFGRRGGGRAGRGSRGGGRSGRAPQNNYFQPQGNAFPPAAAASFAQQQPGHIVPFTGAPANRRTAPAYSNIVKRHANMNVCFSCGFDVEDGHNSSTCPMQWRRPNHQVGFTRANAQQYINAGYDACTRAMHKTQYPTM